MKFKNKLIAAVTAVFTLVCSVPLISAQDADEGFIYSGVTSPSAVTHNLDNKYRHNGTGNKSVHYYGYTRNISSFDDPVFTQGYDYMCYGTGGNSSEYAWNHLTLRYNNITTPLSAGDVVYFSFYYRSASGFTGIADGNTYTGQSTMPFIRFNDKNTAMYELSSGLTSGATGCTEFAADDNWHKAEYYIRLSESHTSLTDFQFWICYMQMGKPCYIQMSNFSYGILKNDGVIGASNQAACTYLGYALNKAKLSSLAVDGKAVKLEDGVTAYEADADSISAVVTAENASSVAPVVSKADDFNYNITAHAPGYDTLLDETRTYTEYLDSEGNFNASASPVTYSVNNENRKTTYTLHLNVKPVNAVCRVNGVETTDISGCADGDTIVIDEIYNNFNDNSYTYVTLLLFYKDGILSGVVPYKTELASLEKDKNESFSYTLGFGDYTGMSCDVMIMDSQTFCEVLK